MTSTNKNIIARDKASTNKKQSVKLSPYQQYLQGQYNKSKQQYFEFYDDVKDKTHKKIDW